MSDVIKILLQAEVAKSSVENIKTQLDGIQRNVKPINIKVDSSGAVKSILNVDGVMTKINATNTKTWENASGEVIKYTHTLKNLEKGLAIVDTYMKNDKGGFDFVGRTINDKSVESTYRALQKAHEQAIKFNSALDETIRKNHQMAKDASWKQYFQGITETSRELQQMNQYYSQLADGGMEKAHGQAIKLNNEFDKLEQVTKKNLLLDTDKMSSRYKNLVSGDDIANVKSMINSLKFDDPNLGRNIDLIKVKMKEVSMGAENSKKSLDLANKSSMSFGEAMKTAAYKFGIWSAITASYYKVIREVMQGIRFITEMDSALTEIGMVTNQTREQTAGLAKEYNNLAKEMKVLTSDLTSSAVEFYRQGLSQEEVMERMRVSTMYSKVANLDFATSAEVLTATVNSMGVDIERAADVFLFLGDSTATSGAEIGKGFQKVGGTASALGIEFEKVASWISVISSKTRESAESIGTSINAMLSRISRITQTGFNEDDDTKLNDVAKALNTVGIALTDQTGNFRDFGTIIDEIAVKWDTLDDKTQSYIANTIGGVRQQSRFFNLMSGYAESMTLYEESLEAAGTAQEKFSLYLESNQATLDKFRTTLEGLWITIIDSDSLMNIVRAGTSFVDLLDNMANSFGLLGSAATILIPLIGIKYVAAITASTKAKIASKLASEGLGNSSISLANGFKLLIGQLFGVKTAADGTAISFMGLNAAAGLLGVALVTIPMLITAIATAEDKRKKAMEESLALFEKQNEVNKSIGELVKSYEELGNKAELTAEENQKLLDVKTKIKDLLPQSKNAIDNENLSLKEQVEIIKDLNEQEFQRASMAASETIDKYGKDVDFYKKSIDERAKSIESMTDKLSELQLKQARGQELTSEESKELKNLIHWIELYNSHQEDAINIVEAVESAYELLNKGLEENAERHKWARAEELESQAVRANSIRQLQGIEEELKSLGFTSDEVAQIMKGNLDEVKDKHNLLTDAQIENYKSIETLSQAEYEWATNRLKNDAEVTRVAIENARARINAIRSEIEALTGRSTAKNAFLQSLYSPDMVDKESAMKDMVGMGAISASLASYRAEEIKTINAEVQQQQEHLSSINQALANLSNVTVTSGSASSPKGSSGSGGSGGSKAGSSKAGGTTKEEYKAEADAYAQINLELERNNVLLQLNKTYQDQAGDDLDKKIKLMEEEIELNKERQGLLHDYNTQMREEAKSLQKDLSGIFNFEGSWDDNSMTITNMDAIAGKSEDIDKKFKRIVAIMGELPKGSQEWATLNNEIQKIELDKLIAEFKLADKVFEDINESISDLEYELKMLELDDFNGKVDNNVKTLAKLKEEVEDTTRQLEELGENGFEAGTKKSDAFIARQIELTTRLKEGKLAAKEYERSLVDLIRSQTRETIEAEKRNAYMDLDLRQRRANEQIQADRDRMDEEVRRKQNQIDGIQSEIDEIQESERARQESLDRSKYLEEISKLQNKYYHLQYVNLGNITEEQAKLVGLEKEREQYLDRQTKSQELQLKLTNLQNEKNIQQLKKQSDGTWDFEYVADQKAIDDVNKQVEDLQKEHDKTIKNLKEQTLDDLKKAQESYDEWERQNDIRRQIEEKQRRIQRYQNEIKDMQDQFAKREKETNEQFAIEKENLDRFYTDMDLLTDEKMVELYETFNGNWLKISKMLTSYFGDIRSEYESLVEALSTPLPNPDKGGGDGGDRGGSGDSNGGSSQSGRSTNNAVGMTTPDGRFSSVNKDYVDKYIKKGYTVRHKGGVVGDGSRDLPEIANRLFNAKPNEQMVKALKGELFVPEENLSKYFLPNMQELLKSAVLSTMSVAVPKMPKVALAGAGGGDQVFHIAKMEFPNVKDGKDLQDAILNLPLVTKQKVRTN